MTEEAFNAYLADRFNKQGEYYSRESRKNQRRFQVSQVTIIACTSMTPLLALLPEPPESHRWKILMAVVAAIAGVSAALEKMFKCGENWLGFRSTRELLKREKFLFDAGAEEYSTPATIEERRQLFVRRIEALLARQNSLWITSYQPKESGTPAPHGGTS